MLDINAISKEEYEITANKINTLDADKDLIRAELDKTILKAPFSGKIGLKNVSQGAYVTPATSLAILVQTNPVKIDFTIPEKYSTMVAVGSNIKFEVEGQPNIYTAKVVAIDPKIDPITRTLQIRAIAPNGNHQLIPGSYAKVSLILKSKGTAIMIPTESVVPEQKGSKVFIVKNGKATPVKIVLGVRNEKEVEVTSGLNGGDSLITTGVMQVKPDGEVEVMK